MNKRQRAQVFDDAAQTARKVVVSAVIIGVFIVYTLLHSRAADTANAPQSTTGLQAAADPQSTPVTSGSSAPVSNGSYRDGAYTGSVADAQWGYVQVKAVIQGGKLADVQFVQYPNERERSQQINNYAIPQLVSEAVQTQSAQVDIVSGATDTSEAFMQSLGDALASAQG